jgi:hypothetical protein
VSVPPVVIIDPEPDFRRRRVVVEFERGIVAPRIELKSSLFSMVRSFCITRAWESPRRTRLRYVVLCELEDRDTGKPIHVEFNGYAATELVDDMGFAAWVRLIVRDILMHEIDECLSVDGTRPFDPHKEPNR